MMSVALITGCSSGFGMLSAARLSAAGHTVYASMRNLQKKEALLVEVESRGGEVKLLKLDVTDNTTIDDAINTIESERGRLDILINNAGYGLGGFFEDISEREFRDQMETNFFGVLKMTRKALPLMRRSITDHGNVKIINISSAQGRAPIPGLGAYGTSKWALEGFSEALYHELTPFGIRVVIVEPGSYRTEIFTSNAHVAEQAENQVSPYARFSVALRRKIETMTKGGSVGMGDNPEVVAELIEKIVTSRSPKLRYVVGRQARIRILLRAVLPMNCYSGLLRKALFGSVERSFET